MFAVEALLLLLGALAVGGGPKQVGGPKLYFLHFSDVHLDPLYDTDPACQGVTTGTVGEMAWRFGCDSPPSLAKAAFNAGRNIAAVSWRRSWYKGGQEKSA